MKKSFIPLIAITAAFFISVDVCSQSSVSMHVGPAFPLADFGDDDIDDENAGGAAVGFNLGMKYSYLLNDIGIGLYVGADFNYNSLKKSVKDDIVELFSTLGVEADIRYPTFINVPVNGGLTYTYRANDLVSLFGDIGLGVDFLKFTDITMEAGDNKMSISYNWSTELAYKIGGGILFKKRYILGINYHGMGSHKLKGKVYYMGTTEDIEEAKLKVSLLALNLGIKF